MSQMDLAYLDEAQNATFDYEYHSADELEWKIRAIRESVGDGPYKILDVGGGNGAFLDKLLSVFPKSEGVLFDISRTLLERNTLNVRKRLVEGSVAHLSDFFLQEKFDVITANWLLHHLVGSSHASSVNNCVLFLEQCGNLLSDKGRILVAENMFEGLCGANVPSWIIFSITHIKTPWIVSITSKFFNTAGTGVCFNTKTAWKRIFESAGLVLCSETRGRIWQLSLRKRIAFYALGIRDVAHGHFCLRRRSSRTA